MRVISCFAVAAATIWIAEPVRAQTYDPRYPVCMQTYGPLSGINCTGGQIVEPIHPKAMPMILGDEVSRSGC
jgi:hypothetical protein